MSKIKDMNQRSAAIAVAIGGIIGVNLRYGISMLVPFAPSSSLPIATFSVNMIGTCFLGWLTGWLHHRKQASPMWKLTLGTGMAGALTTFSTFSLETVQLMAEGRWRAAIGYQLISIGCGIGAAWIGYSIGDQPPSESSQEGLKGRSDAE